MCVNLYNTVSSPDASITMSGKSTQHSTLKAPKNNLLNWIREVCRKFGMFIYLSIKSIL